MLGMLIFMYSAQNVTDLEYMKRDDGILAALVAVYISRYGV